MKPAAAGKAGANKIIDAGSKRLQAAASEKSGDLIRKSLSGLLRNEKLSRRKTQHLKLQQRLPRQRQNQKQKNQKVQ